jgi:hypothetical protein
MEFGGGPSQSKNRQRTRERVPLRWAHSLGNQGVALVSIADRKNDAVAAEAALRQIETAYETLHSGGQEQWSAEMETQLIKARAIRDRLTSVAKP